MTDGLLGPKHGELVELGKLLRSTGYRFTTVTPDTHAAFLQHAPARARDLRDVLGWNLPFEETLLDEPVRRALLAADAVEQLSDGRLKAKLRCSTLDELLFFHSGFPTQQADAVFFGPDSYRFVRALWQRLSGARGVVVDVGCGSGVGGIALARRINVRTLVLADINPRALQLAGVNAALNDVQAELVVSDVLDQIPGKLDLVIANPPYLADPGKRAYRDGGGELGAGLSERIVRDCAYRLPGSRGRLLLYTGVAIVAGEDRMLAMARAELPRVGAQLSYEEIDPDVFGSELAQPLYQGVERIAAVLLDARFGGHVAC